MAIDISKLNLPEEISVNDAARILTVSRRTVVRYIEDGLLIARNVAPLRSKQMSYRLPLKAVLEMRTSYELHQTSNAERKERRQVKRYEPQTMKRK
jgi:plasmid maintenance system antidote protein VapI